MTDCGAPDPTGLLAERLAGYLDCHAQSIAETGFHGFTGGWLGPALLGGFLTIYVALIGYRLVLALPFGPRDAVLAAARAGVVIAAATSWSAYQTTAYRLVFDGPAEAAGVVLPSDISASSLVETAQRLDKDLRALSAASSGLPPASTASNTATVSNTAAPTDATAPTQSAPAGPRVADQEPLWSGAAVAVANVTIGVLGAIRIAGGLLLAVGPLFIMLALFDSTLGMFEGWVRGLVTAFVASVGSMLVTALELGFIETQLIDSNPAASASDLAAQPALLVVATLFGVIVLGVLAGAILVGAAFHLPRGRRAALEFPAADREGARSAAPISITLAPASRAEVVADAVRRLTQWETIQSTRSNPASRVQLQDHLLQRRSAATSTAGKTGPSRRTSPIEATRLQRRERPS